MQNFNLPGLAKLARLHLTESGQAALALEISNIMQLIDQLQSVNTDGISPMAHPLDLPQRLREDVITETDQHQIFQAIAPHVENDLYLVPRVIEEA